MTYPHGGASEIWRDGVGGAHNPEKSEIRDWGEWVQGVLSNGVALESFGEVGAGSNDNALLAAALATGLPVIAFGPEYRFDQFLFNDTSVGKAAVLFGPTTKVRGVQASGAKKPMLRFEGALLGTSVAVTAFGTGSAIGHNSGEDYHTDTVTVADASQFSVGDTVLLTETADPIAQDHWPTSPAATDDFNYREFTTIAAINGNDISFDEFMRWPYSTANNPTLQRVDFMENVHVSGGIYEGPNSVGGGVGMALCRHSYVDVPMCKGEGESSRMGGAPVSWDRCWEITEGRVHSRWTLFTHYSVQCQSSFFDKVGGKRTSNGGAILSGDTYCHFDTIVQDSPGDDNGDGMGWSGGFRRNTIGNFILSGARCYGLWARQSCDENVVMNFASKAGITGGVYIFGNRNKFLNVDIKGHPSFGLGILGDYNEFPNVDIDVEGAAISVTGIGNKVKGRAISRGTDSLSRDVLMNDGATDNVIHIQGGDRGLAYAGAVQPHHSNDLIVTGPNPYTLTKAVFGRGWKWSNVISGVTNTPQNIKIPGSGANGLADLLASAGDAAVSYRISLKLNSGLADTVAEYIATDRQSTWSIDTIYQGSGTYAVYVPKLQATGANLQVFKDNATALNVLMLIEKF